MKLKSIFFLIAVQVLVASWPVLSVWADVPNTWTVTGNMATSRRHSTFTQLPDGRILVVGGVDTTGTNFSGSVFHSSAEIYDPETGLFAPTGSLTTGGRALHTANLLRNGKVLITGGWNGAASLSSAELYDPATGIFTATGNMTATRSQHTVTLLDNGKVLIAGGFGTGPLASAELYDPLTGTFSSTTGTMSAARNTHTATLLPSGKVLVVGGYGLSSELSSAEFYDPNSGGNGSFSATGGLSQGRGSHRATILPNGRVLVTGGNGGVVAAPLSSAELYDPNVNSGNGGFVPASNLIQPRQWHSAVLMANGKVLVAGGNNNSSGHWDIQTNFLASAEIYDPIADAFTTTASMGTARSMLNRIVIWTGKVLVAGGGSNTAELFCPEILGIEGTWNPTANDLTTGRQGFQITSLDNGNVLNSGGVDQAGNLLASAELYDYITNTFSSTGSMSTPRHQQRDILLSNGKVLVTGGRSAAAANTLNTAELYDPVGGTFAPTSTNMGTFRRLHRLTRLADNRILMSGGRGGALTTSNGILASAQIYDPVTDLFTVTGSMQVPRTNHRTTRLPDGRVLITGGTTTGNVVVDSAEIFDPNANAGVGAFTALAAAMSVPRDGHTSALLPIGQVLIIGGNDAALNPLASAEIFDPVTLTFSPAGSMNVSRDNHRTTILDNGKVLLSGGRTSITASSVTTSSELYDFTTGVSQLTGNLSVAREFHGGLGLPNGLTIVIGGVDSSGTVLASAEVYSTPICNMPPVCNDDAYRATENVALIVGAPGVLGNDSDFDGNPLNAILVSAPNPTHGSVTLNPNGGFTFVPAPDFAGTTSFTYMANDGQADSNLGTVTITVFGVTTTTPPSGTTGVAYNQTLTVLGGTAPFMWSLVAGALPPGLSLSSAGVISGTPTTTGTFNFTVRVTDANEAFDEEALTIVIDSNDSDGDGIPDNLDNAPFVYNPDQTDTDNDGRGNAGVAALFDDNCPAHANASQADSDGDLLGDACDDKTVTTALTSGGTTVDPGAPILVTFTIAFDAAALAHGRAFAPDCDNTMFPIVVDSNANVLSLQDRLKPRKAYLESEGGDLIDLTQLQPPFQRAVTCDLLEIVSEPPPPGNYALNSFYWNDVTVPGQDVYVGTVKSNDVNFTVNAGIPGTRADMDILPGEFPNDINLRSNKKIKTALFGTKTLLNQIDVRSLRLAAAPVKKSNGIRTINGQTALVVYFEGKDMNLPAFPVDTLAVLTGQLRSGEKITAVDSVHIIKQRKHHDDDDADDDDDSDDDDDDDDHGS